MAVKIKDDDEMFNELRQLRAHKFQRSMQFDGMSLVNRDASASAASLSNYSQNGFGYGIFTHPTNAELGLKPARTQIINLFSAEDFDDMEEEDIIIDMEPPQPYDDDNIETVQPNDQPRKKVSFLVPNKTISDQKEEEKQKKREEMFKINAEIEFFLITCIAVKQNLAEEYPNNLEFMTENPQTLFELAQKQHVHFNKFGIWIEYELREKYDLPKIEGFQKILEKYHVKENLKNGFEKTKYVTKQLVKKTETASMKAGHYIAEKAEEIDDKIKSYSKPKQEYDGTYDNEKQNNETMDDENKDDTCINSEMNNNINYGMQINDATKIENNDLNKIINDDSRVNNVNNKQCCVIF
eukprot:447695_1